MDGPLFISLVSFLKGVYPDTHCFVHDNDPKHCSKVARRYYQAMGVNWWTTPAEPPHLDPIDNFWHKLKEYIWREVKHRTKQECIQGIKACWVTITVEKCQRYIGHLNKEIPAVIACDVSAAGY